MIKPNELRIGNYLKWKDNGQDFPVILALFVHPPFWKHIEQGHIEPIALTPEVLALCDLLKDGVFADIEYFSVQNESLYFTGLYTAVDGIKYLHQLQNLYFALTGVELVVNL